jgi:predicted AAA+ superfamily ATPase
MFQRGTAVARARSGDLLPLGPATDGQEYILEDTLLGRFLPAFRRRPKRRTVAGPKFYFADVGVANVLAKRGRVLRGSSVYGKAFESWVFHELSAFDAYSETAAGLAYWRLTTGVEVDFIIGDMDAAIEAKASARVTSDHLSGLRELAKDFPGARRYVVALESRSRVTDDGITILTVSEFLRRLYAGDLMSSG